MECRETGEFVHRELTTFEQKETFNDEVYLCLSVYIYCIYYICIYIYIRISN